MTKESKKWVTAQDLMNELNNDTDYLAKRALKEARIRDRFGKLELQLTECIKHLNKAGFQGDSLESVVKLNSPLKVQAVEIMLQALEANIETVNKERLVRALAATQVDFDGKILGDLFDMVNDESFRFAILNTIVFAKPRGLDKFIDRIWLDEYRRKQMRDLGFRR